jgi:hypothetical protein
MYAARRAASCAFRESLDARMGAQSDGSDGFGGGGGGGGVGATIGAGGTVGAGAITGVGTDGSDGWFITVGGDAVWRPVDNGKVATAG